MMAQELFVCVEFWGDGDPFFGGKADDRTLMGDGLGFYTPPRKGIRPYHPALFTTRKAAILAGEKAGNRRHDGKLGACPAGRFDLQDGIAA